MAVYYFWNCDVTPCRWSYLVGVKIEKEGLELIKKELLLIKKE